jgi:hypothetical protein
MSGESLFDRSLSVVERLRDRAVNDLLNCVPLSFERTRKYYPGVEQGIYYCVTASSGVGKSKFAKYMFVTEPYKYTINNPDCGIKLKMFYFCLEESKESFMLSLISNYLFERYTIRMSVKQLKSIGEPGFYLPEDTLNKIKEAKEYFRKLESTLVVHDNIRNPTGIYLTAKKYAEDNGTWTYKEINIDGKTQRVKDKYIPNDPDEYVIIITDHVSLLHTEKDSNGSYKTLHQSMTDHSHFMMELRDKYNHIPVNVQQQEMTKERKQFTFKGESITEKLEPSLDGLADNKIIGRDYNVVIGIFAPNRYQIERYEGYDITKIQDNFRMMLFLKMRDDQSDLKTPLFFDGAVNYFRELPKVSDITELERVYRYSKDIR